MWLRGIALLDGNHDDAGLESKRPALWLDLVQLASACDGNPTNQKESA